MDRGKRKTLPDRAWELVEQVEYKADKSDDVIVEAAQHLHELCTLVLASGRKWETWASKNLRIGASKRRMLLQIARAENPRMEARRLREKNAERQRRHRNKTPAESDLSDDQRELIKWTRSANLKDVRVILEVIHKRKSWSVSRPDSRSAFQQPAA